MKTIILNLALFLFFVNTSAQSPSWVKNMGKDAAFPEAEYLMGFASANQDSDPNATTQAIANLANIVYTRVSSNSEVLLVKNKDERIKNFKKEVKTSSLVDLGGMETKTHVDKKAKVQYAVAYLKRSALIERYQTIYQQAIKQINEGFNLGVRAQNDGDNTNALKYFHSSIQAFPQYENALMILATMSSEPPLQARIENEKEDVQSRIDAIINREFYSLEDKAAYLAHLINLQINLNAKPVKTHPFTYQTEAFSSEFGHYFSELCAKKLSKESDCEKEQLEADSDYVLNAAYWEEGNKIKLEAELTNTKTGDSKAIANLTIHQTAIADKGLSIKPQNTETAIREQDVFKVDDIVNNDLQLEVWTDKGDKKILYQAGEEPKFYVKVSQACFVRFIYHLADGSRTLLLDNFQVPTNQIGQLYEIPIEFECAEPFGAEMLQANAQTAPFASLKTWEDYGYVFINEPLAAINEKNRGIRKKKEQSKQPKADSNILRAETRLQITTIK